MNPKDISSFARIFNLKIEKDHHFKPALDKVCHFLKSLVCDFETIYAKIHLMIFNHVYLPPLEDPIITVEGIPDLNCEATNYPDLGIIFRLNKNFEMIFLAATAFYRCSNTQLEEI